jgi:hypothetical protein
MSNARPNVSPETAAWATALKKEVDTLRGEVTRLSQQVTVLSKSQSGTALSSGVTVQRQTEPVVLDTMIGPTQVGAGPGDDPLVLSLGSVDVPAGYTSVQIHSTVSVTLSSPSASGISVTIEGIGASGVANPYAASVPYVESDNYMLLTVPTTAPNLSTTVSAVVSTALDAADLGWAPGQRLYLIARIDAASASSGAVISVLANASASAVFKN